MWLLYVPQMIYLRSYRLKTWANPDNYILSILAPASSLLILHQTGAGFTNAKLIGNRVQITGCRATVSNAKGFCQQMLTVLINGKSGRNVTSQETCLPPN